ncbi:cysteine desulfurase family protein [Pelagibacterium xiamenense]|uniref:cysteine desulfurase family protein n=1 Tax=Pelagibacterium xiamenense TaxID=2901140 RepID=UPI001E46D719|nr:aminotransferase class V-fold PLP-dependent enzyme [Pelagibacterium xiamenense]MCD7061100.1 aminotransferase class V-fold PLP-dependent enzyme [Pelagibacterium xiamenense]
MDRMRHYLDHNASAPLLPEAREAVVAALELTGNPSSVHGAGRALRKVVDDARDRVARRAGAEAKQVVFTGSATEAITQAIVGGVKAFDIDRVVIGATDHAAVLKAAEASGVSVRVLGVDKNGLIDIDALSRMLEAADAAGETLLVAVGWVNNETGVVQPRSRIEAIVGPTRHVLLLDAVQGFGKLDLDFSACATDMVAISGHKIGAPAGIGALLAKSHADTVRLVPGGGQEQGRRGGTEAAALIAGFGAACAAFAERFDLDAVGKLVTRFEQRLRQLAPEAVIFGADVERIGTTVNFAVPGVRNTVAMMGLDLAGVAVSSGSACSSGKVGRSHVLSAMGVDPALSECGLRASLGWNSTQDDVDAFFEAFEIVLTRHHGRGGAAA